MKYDPRWSDPGSSRPGEGPYTAKLRRWLELHSNLEAARLLGQVLDAAAGSSTVAGGDPFWSANQSALEETPIPMSDRRALRDYVRECQKLLKLIEADYGLGLVEQAESRKAEVRVILAHIREITRRRYQIRDFPTAAVKDYQRRFQNCRYLLKLLRGEDPDLWRYLKRHLRTGRAFVWIGGLEEGSDDAGRDEGWDDDPREEGWHDDGEEGAIDD